MSPNDRRALRAEMRAICNDAIVRITRLGYPVAEVEADYAYDDAIELAIQIMPVHRPAETAQLPQPEPFAPPAPPSNQSTYTTACDRDIMTTIKEVGHRMTTAEVVVELERRGRLHGESTIKGSLARLCRAGMLTNRQHVRPRGYGLPEWSE